MDKLLLVCLFFSLLVLVGMIYWPPVDTIKPFGWQMSTRKVAKVLVGPVGLATVLVAVAVAAS